MRVIRGAAYPTSRHPGEGRGPALDIGHAESWIPAFAGMTASKLISFGGVAVDQGANT